MQNKCRCCVGLTWSYHSHSIRIRCPAHEVRNSGWPRGSPRTIPARVREWLVPAPSVRPSSNAWKRWAFFAAVNARFPASRKHKGLDFCVAGGSCFACRKTVEESNISLSSPVPGGCSAYDTNESGRCPSAALLQETFLDCGGDAQNHFCSNDQRGCAGQHEALRNAACAVHPCHSVLAEPKQPAAVVTVSLPAHAPGCVLFSQMVLVQVGCTEYLALGFCHVFLLRRLFKERGVMGRCSRCFDVRKRRGGAPLRKSLKTMFSFGIHPLKHHLKDAVFLVASHVRRAGTTRSKRIRQH